MCIDGTRRSVRDYQNCNWGQIPSNALVTTSAKSVDTRRKYQKFLTKLVEIFGSNAANPRPANFPNSTFNDPISFNDRNFINRDFNIIDLKPVSITNGSFRLFESSPRYGKLYDLLFQDDSINLKVKPINNLFEFWTNNGTIFLLFKSIPSDQQTYSGYLGIALDAILGIRQCPVKSMTMCVTSPAELTKCIRMRTAMKAQLLQPEMSCYKADNDLGCMRVCLFFHIQG